MGHDDRPVIVIERSSGVGAFLFGAALGAVAALLLAPQSGEETRKVIGERGRRVRDRASEAVDDLTERVGDGYENAKQRFEDGFESVRDGLTERRTDAQEAVDAGKAAVSSARDELERRLSESRSRRKVTAAEEVED
jgi:gas vesicle protein